MTRGRRRAPTSPSPSTTTAPRHVSARSPPPSPTAPIRARSCSPAVTSRRGWRVLSAKPRRIRRQYSPNTETGAQLCARRPASCLSERAICARAMVALWRGRRRCRWCALPMRYHPPPARHPLPSTWQVIYDPCTSPRVTSISPAYADATRSVEIAVSAVNLAPTPGLVCVFEELRVTAATYVRCAHAPHVATAASVGCSAVVALVLFGLRLGPPRAVITPRAASHRRRLVRSSRASASPSRRIPRRLLGRIRRASRCMSRARLPTQSRSRRAQRTSAAAQMP